MKAYMIRTGVFENSLLGEVHQRQMKATTDIWAFYEPAYNSKGICYLFNRKQIMEDLFLGWNLAFKAKYFCYLRNLYRWVAIKIVKYTLTALSTKYCAKKTVWNFLKMLKSYHMIQQLHS